MWALLLSTIVTSAADSLNPIAITQQFVLQGLVKKPRHIWYFILATGVTNLLGGFLAYFGLATVIGDFFTALIAAHGRIVFTCELILGIAFLLAGYHLIQNQKVEALKREVRLLTPGAQAGDEAEAAGKIKSVSPMALLLLGIGATISELATALPYFAFLAILFQHRLSPLPLTFVLVVYNVIYMAPLMVMYVVYANARHRFDHFYAAAKRQLTKWASVIAPAAAGAVGVALLFHSMLNLLP